jgi:hypothetical protein
MLTLMHAQGQLAVTPVIHQTALIVRELLVSSNDKVSIGENWNFDLTYLKALI